MFYNACKALQPEIVKYRRDLHQIPEAGTAHPLTCAYIAAELDKMGIPYKLIEGDAGVIADIVGKPGKTVALRADIDALPIVEATGLDFAATNGCMHACGHDAHAAMLLGAAKVLNENKANLNGTVRLFFQSAEEILMGAKAMIAAGGLEGVDAVFGTHIGSILDPNIPSGTFICTPGCCMASVDKFTINVKGVGCHGSTPEKGVDPVNIGAHIIIALQAINAREFNACVPFVLTIGSIHAGSQYNIIPNEMTIEGTIRTLDPDVRKRVAQRIGEVSAATAVAFGGTAELDMFWGAPPVINTKEMAALGAEAAAEVLGAENVITYREFPNMGGEDFAYYLEQVPGAFMFLSSSDPAKGTHIAHHNAKFDVDEDVLWSGSAVFVNIAEKFLG